MIKYRAMLLSATATAALLGASQGASAFEVVDWDWTHTVAGHTNVNVDVVVSNDPSGLVQVEKLQMHFGDIRADAHVSGVHNEAGVNDGGTISETVDVVINYQDGSGILGDLVESSANPILPEPASSLTPSGGLTVSLVDQGGGNYGNVDEISEYVTFQLQVDGTIAPSEALDALDLPMIENAATAVVNNQSIEANVPIYLHDAQFAAGGFNSVCDDGDGLCTTLGVVLGSAGLFEVDQDLGGINEHTTMAGLMTVAAATGLVNAANVEANASVSDVLNAYVDNAATAVTNNASFTIESDVDANHIMVADLTQWGYANVAATAGVADVTIEGYTNFGGAGLGGALGDITPVVSNAATAVGNNLSISVGVGGDD